MRPNPNRIITIKRNGSASTNETWKSNLRYILTNRGDKKLAVGSSENLDALNVNNNIDLYIEDNFPQISIDNGRSDKYPLQAIISATGNAAGNWLNNKTKAISAVASKLGFDKNTNISDIIGSGVEAAGGFIQGLTGTGGTQTTTSLTPWVTQVPSWSAQDSLKGLEFSLTFKFSMGKYGIWNAKEEVAKPILNLLAPVLPQYLNHFTVNGPYPTGAALLGTIIGNLAGDTINALTDAYSAAKEWFTSSKEDDSDNGAANKNTSTEIATDAEGGEGILDKMGSYLQDLVTRSYENYTFEMQFGTFLSLKRCLIRDATVDFSPDTDQYGYPVSGTITLKCYNIIPIALSAGSEDNLAARFRLN